MENILKKDIFTDRDLNKLSPDYKPLHIMLRMQMRRNFMRETHNHNIHKYNSQRKPLKKSKDTYKINREIVKIRNSFQNINLKNEIMFKGIDSSKSNTNLGNEDVLINSYKSADGDDIDVYLQEISDDMSDLVIRNDLEFKINSKPINELKLNSEMKKNRKHIKDDDGFETLPISPKQENDRNEDVLKVVCKQSNHIKTNERPAFLKELSQNDFKLCPSQNKDDIPLLTQSEEPDLQTFLIMMALSPKSNSSEDVGCTNAYVNSNDKQYEKEEMIKHSNNITIMGNLLDYDDISDVLSVTPIRIEISDRQTSILRKYVEKWKSFVKNRRDYMFQQRQETLNNFFDRLSKKKLSISETPEPTEKAKHLSRDYSTYQHRYKVQRHIIALQKAKLEEQNRLIEELKYNKIVKASRQSVDAMREEVRRSYYEIDRQLKPKIKCLTNELKLHEIEEQSLVLHCLKVPQFLQRMEKRAREREEKHAIIRERRRQMEEDRIRLKQQAELAKAEMDKEEKLKRIKELKQKRKKEKVENIRKKQHVERLRSLIVMADLHYEKYLMSTYGIRPLRYLMKIKRDNIEMARAHYKFQLKKNVFLHWMWHTEDMSFEKNYIAENFHRRKLLRKTFEGLKENHYEYAMKKQVAEDYYDLYVSQLVFRKFREGIAIIKKEYEIKWRKVVQYHISNLLFKTFTCWRTLPALNELKREQEARKSRWREKVLQVVPDYAPPDD